MADDNVSDWFWGKVLYWLSSAGKAAAVGGGVSLFFTDLVDNTFMGILEWVLGMLDQLDLAEFAPNRGLIASIETINGIIPLSEFITMFAAYGVAWGIVLLVRWVKSFIPTVSN